MGAAARIVRRCIGVAVATVGMLAAVGCAVDRPARFYTLSPMEQNPLTAASVTGKRVSVAVGPVTLPDYLKRPRIVNRIGKNMLVAADCDRWAGALDENLSMVVTENLALLLASDNVYLHPGADYATPAYQVAVDVIRFEGVNRQNVELLARWTLVDVRRQVTMGRGRAFFSRPIPGQGTAGLVSTMNLVLADLSRRIAAELSSCQGVSAPETDETR